MACYYLPEGRWTNFLTGEQKEGGKWYREEHGYLSIPLMVRENSIIALGRDCGPVYDYADGVTFRAYELAEGGTAATEVYDGAAERTASIRIGKKDGKLDIRVESEKAYRIELVNVKASSVTTEDGRISMEYRDNCTIITAEGSRQICCGL